LGKKKGKCKKGKKKNGGSGVEKHTKNPKNKIKTSAKKGEKKGNT